MTRFFKNNSLSIVFFMLFLLALIGQLIAGFDEHNKERLEDGIASLRFTAYLTSGHFLQATFENWESEFLQMALFVVLTVSLRQKGSSESKSFEKEKVDKKPSPHKKNVPWPVKKGGIILRIYNNSLSIALFILFILSFIIHLYGSLKDENERLLHKGLPAEGWSNYITSPGFGLNPFKTGKANFYRCLQLLYYPFFCGKRIVSIKTC